MSSQHPASTHKGQTISLVLGSGGARGLAHIGAIKAIEQHGYRIESISGCSMGALVGGIYAQGSLTEYETWVRSLNKLEMFRLLDISLARGGLVKGDRLIEHLRELVGEQKIEDLAIRYTAVATDIDRQKEVWIDRGPLFDAIRASISLPLFFMPFKRGNARLVDGGVLNPLPIAPTFRDNTDLTIAVSLSGPSDPELESLGKGKSEESSLTKWISKLGNQVDELWKREAGIYDVLTRSYELMQDTIVRQKLAVYPPDITIEIPRNACSPVGYDEAERLIDLGYARADAVLKARQRGR